MVLTIIVLIAMLSFSARAQSDGSDDDYIDSLPDVRCRLPQERGFCKALIVRWSYDPRTRRCREFIFGGCSKRITNNFPSQKTCMDTCSDVW